MTDYQLKEDISDSIFQPRDESSLVLLGSELYMLGGLGQDTVEVLDTALDAAWVQGPKLPDVISR